MSQVFLPLKNEDGSFNVDGVVFIQRLWLKYQFNKCVQGLKLFKEGDLLGVVKRQFRLSSTSVVTHAIQGGEQGNQPPSNLRFSIEFRKEIHFLKIFCSRFRILPRLLAVMEFQVSSQISSDTIRMIRWAGRMCRLRMFFVYMVYLTCFSENLFFAKKNEYNGFFVVLESRLKTSSEVIYSKFLELIDHLCIIHERGEFIDSSGKCFFAKEIAFHSPANKRTTTEVSFMYDTKDTLDFVLGGFHGFVDAYTFWKNKRYLSYALASHMNILHLCSLFQNKDMTVLCQDRRKYILAMKDDEERRMMNFLDKDENGRMISLILDQKQRNHVSCGMKNLGKSAFCCVKPSRHGYVDYFNCDVLNEDYVLHQYFLSGKRFSIPENVINFGLCIRYQSHLRCLRMEIEFGLLQKQKITGVKVEKLLLQPEHLNCSKSGLHWEHFSNPLFLAWDRALVALNTRMYYLFQEIYFPPANNHQVSRNVTCLLNPDHRKFKRIGVQRIVHARREFDFSFDFQLFQTLLRTKFIGKGKGYGRFRFWSKVSALFLNVEKILDCLRKNFTAEDDFEQCKFSFKFLMQSILYWKQWNFLQDGERSFLKNKLRPKEWMEIFLMVQIYDYWYQSIFQCEILATNRRLSKKVVLNILNSSSMHGKIVFQSKYYIDVDQCGIDRDYLEEKMTDIARTRLWIRRVLLFMHCSNRSAAAMKDLGDMAAFDSLIQKSDFTQTMYAKLLAFKDEWQKYTMIPAISPFDDPCFCQILKSMFVFCVTDSFGFLFRETMVGIKNALSGLNQQEFTKSECTGVYIWNLMESSVSLNSWNSSIAYYPETFVLDVDFLNKLKYLNYRIICLLTFATKMDQLLVEDVLEGQQANFQFFPRFFLGIHNDYVGEVDESCDFWFLEDSLEMIRFDTETFVQMLTKVFFDLDSKNISRIAQLFIQSLDEQDSVYQMCRQELVVFWIEMLRSVESFRQLKSEQKNMIFRSNNDSKKTTFSNLKRSAVPKGLLLNAIFYCDNVLLHFNQKMKPVLFLNFNIFRNLYQVLYPSELDLLLHWMSCSS